ncbi:hypothetical protein OS187_00720 [Xanthomonadaceae bacterium JHOS43]|nr:hypothetical protein [Xanthomonadaceae bacterium JHOS43]MCX7563464.1 hypothetical protein [Xanthomonadaceae bacterium XH05]
MKSRHILFGIALLLAPAASCWAQSGGFQRLTIPDTSGFERTIPAFTVDVPSGWQGSGVVFWDNTQCPQTVPSMRWQARSPNGEHVFELLPRWASQMADPVLGNSMPGCPTMPFSSIRDYLEHLARQRHPAGRILDYRPRPDLVAQLQVPPALSVPGGPVQNRNWGEAGEILVGWDENGRQMRESIMVSGTFMEMRMDMPMTGPARSLSLYTSAAATMRAPDGQLDLALFNHMRSSVRADANWQARMNKHESEMTRIAIKGSRERSQIITKSNAEANRIRNQTWENQQKSQEAAHASFINTIRGVQPHHDPHSGGTVELSNQHDHSWRLNDGTYYQTDDPSFNPYVELGVDGTELEPVDY